VRTTAPPPWIDRAASCRDPRAGATRGPGRGTDRPRRTSGDPPSTSDGVGLPAGPAGRAGGYRL